MQSRHQLGNWCHPCTESYRLLILIRCYSHIILKHLAKTTLVIKTCVQRNLYYWPELTEFFFGMIDPQ
jgi:hypothetical protein